MKKQIILTIIGGIILAFLIYKATYHEDVSILALGDGLSLGKTAYQVEGYSYNDYLRDYFKENSILKEFTKDFAMSDETPDTLIEKIDNNFKLEGKNITINQQLAKANIVTIHIGMEYFEEKNTIKDKDIKKYLKEMEELIKKIRVFHNKEIYLIGVYKRNKINEKQASKINEGLLKIANTYNCHFIDISFVSQNEEYFFEPKNFYLNYKGHRRISELIISNLE